MKKIIDIAQTTKVQWKSLAGPIDENFDELDKNKLSKDDLAQTTGDSTAVPMSQAAVTNAIEEATANPAYTNYITCSTTNDVANKTVNILNFKLSNRVRLLIKMVNANTADNANLSISSPQLNTKPLYYNGERASANNSWEAGAVLDVYYDGTNFQATDFAGGAGNSSGGNMILEWNTDVATTRKQVKQADRKEGMQISYKNDDGEWINEQFIGTSVTDTEWSYDTNWKNLDTYAITLVGEEIGDVIPPYSITADYGVNADTGEFTYLKDSSVCNYPVYGYKYILTNVEATTGNIGLAFYGEDNKYISGHKEFGTGAKNVLIQIPENACILKIRRKSQSVNDKLIGISYNKNSGTKFYLKPDSAIDYRNGKDISVVSADIASTTPIFCKGEKSVTVTVRANSNISNETGLAFYGLNGFISGISAFDSTVSEATSKKKTVSIPEDAIYFRSTYFESKDDFSISFNENYVDGDEKVEYLSRYVCENYIASDSFTYTAGFSSVIAPLPKSGKFTLSGYTNRPKSTLTYFAADPSINKVTAIAKIDIGGTSEKTLEAPRGAKFFSVFSRVPDVMDDKDTLKMSYVGEKYEDDPKRICLIPTDIIATTKNYILEQVERDGKEYFRYSQDLGETWVEKENTIGAISLVHWFSDGTCLICGHTECYTTKDFVSLEPSIVLDENGELFVPEAQHFFAAFGNHNLYYKLNGKEALIWPDYNTASAYISRIWMTLDQGKTIKCIVKNKTTRAVDGKTISVRHFHHTCFDDSEQKLYITAGDHGSEIIMIIGTYDKDEEKFVFEVLGPEDKYKLGVFFIKGPLAVFITDYTNISEDLPSGLVYCYKDQIKNFRPNYLYIDKDKTPFSDYYSDSNNNHLLFGDGEVYNKIWIAKNNYNFSPHKFFNKRVSAQSTHGPNYRGDLMLRTTDGYSSEGNTAEKLRINRKGFRFNLAESLRQSGVSDFLKLINIFKNNYVD